jgi:lipopolysaccharide/colanic/teichoic acid biosynthesis glycosyltransferase
MHAFDLGAISRTREQKMEEGIRTKPEENSGAQHSLEVRRASATMFPLNTVFLKRALDLLVSGIGLVCVLPIFLIIALLIELDSPGPVFYTQMRIGQERRWRRRRREELRVRAERRQSDRRNVLSHGKLFRIYKFRTMVSNAEDITGPTWSTPQDPRITRVGRVLRALRLDELPQLWNVFRGDMSLVGPRPERPHFVYKFADKIPEYTERLRVRPGITGLAQVSTLDEITEEEIGRKLLLDLRYVRDLRFVSDLKILLRTFVVLLKKGVHLNG